MCLINFVTNIFAIVGFYVILRETILPLLKEHLPFIFIQSKDTIKIDIEDELDEYIEIDDCTKLWSLLNHGCQYTRKPSLWSVSSLDYTRYSTGSSISSTSSLDLDFELPSPTCLLTSTMNYSRKSSIWSMSSEDYSQSFNNKYSSGSSSSSLDDFSVGSSGISGLNWISHSTSSTCFRPSLTSISEDLSSNISSHRLQKPSLTNMDEEVFQNDTHSFNGGYYTLTTLNSRDMLSCSSDLPESDISTGTDSAISSGGTTPEVTNDFDADITSYQCGGTPFPSCKIDYEKPPGPSPYGMRRRRIFTFSNVANN